MSKAPSPDWSASQYLKFEDERSRPARDLLARVPLASARTVVDLGCGPGNSTEILAARFPEAAVIGVDNSPDMLAAARTRLPGATFINADIGAWKPDAPVDLIFANAVFQWIPDHVTVLRRLMLSLRAGGVLAVQVPDNHDEPTHTLMRETAQSGPWQAKFAEPIAREAIQSPAHYYDALASLSAHVDVWRTTYHHPLADAAAIVAWMEGTGLRPYLARLDAAEKADWLAAYTKRIAEAFPPRADGRVLLPFPRLFLLAVKA